MSRQDVLTTIAFLLLSVPAHTQPILKLVDTLEPLFPDSNNTQRFDHRYEAHFPSGTVADVHVLLTLQPGESFTIAANLNGTHLPVSCWSELLDVPVEQNTGLDSRTEMFTNQHNPYVIRRAPFRIFEALQPLSATTVTARSHYTALRLSIPSNLLAARAPIALRLRHRGRRGNRRGSSQPSFTVCLCRNSAKAHSSTPTGLVWAKWKRNTLSFAGAKSGTPCWTNTPR